MDSWEERLSPVASDTCDPREEGGAGGCGRRAWGVDVMSLLHYLAQRSLVKRRWSSSASSTSVASLFRGHPWRLWEVSHLWDFTG